MPEETAAGHGEDERSAHPWKWPPSVCRMIYRPAGLTAVIQLI